MRSLIIANGNITQAPATTGFDLIIAADGGARHCLELGIQPDVVIGDMDSLDPALQQSLARQGAQFQRYPTHKDYTDLELALNHARDLGSEEIVVAGALGYRWDQTLANVLLPAAAEFRGVRILLVDGAQEMHLVRSGERLTISGAPGDTLSLIPICGDAQGLYTQGLEYPLNNETISFGSTRGISNVLLNDTAVVELQEGLLICVVIHQDGS